MSLFGNRIGNRLLVCPECCEAIWDAGPGRAFCSGDHGPRQPPHAEIEMWAYARELPAPVTEREARESAAQLAERLRAILDADRYHIDTDLIVAARAALAVFDAKEKTA